MQKTFTIKEIRKYLEGCLLNDGHGVPSKDYNLALSGAITFLEDKEDGIAGILAREQWFIQKMPLDKYVGCKCGLFPSSKSCVVMEVNNKKRKLLISSGSCTFWISTKTFFGKWRWGNSLTCKL